MLVCILHTDLIRQYDKYGAEIHVKTGHVRILGNRQIDDRDLEKGPHSAHKAVVIEMTIREENRRLLAKRVS